MSDTMTKKPTPAGTAPGPMKRSIAPLTNARFKTLVCSAANWGSCHGVAVPKGTPPDDLLDPGFWSNVAPSLLVGDWIRAVADDGTLRASYRCAPCQAQAMAG